MRLFPALLTLALLAGCAQAGTPTARQDGGLEAASLLPPQADTKVNPDDARERAIKKAKEWSADARLVGEAWAMAKFELTSVVFHVFQSNKAGKLLIVESKMVNFWQKTREISDKKLTLPARLLDTLDEKYVSAEQAIEVAKGYMKPGGDDHPVAFLVLWKPNRFSPAFYGVKAAEQKVLIHAKSGKALLHTDIGIPFWPFGEEDASAEAP
jgi:hypothetical protein